jgi:rod shape-determining protein MreC
VLLVATLVSITVITLDQRGQTRGVIEDVRSGARDAFAPLRSGVDSAVSWSGDVIGGITDYGDLKAENDRLRRQLDDARGAQARAADADRERRDLLRINQLSFAGDIPSITARVIATAPSNFELTVTIDRGRNDGLVRGMPVVTGEGLVGRVVQVSRREAVVLLLTDPAFQVGIRLPSGDLGVAKGRGRGESLEGDLIDPSTVLHSRDVVVTSGQQQALPSYFPPGIPVGRIRSAKARRGQLQQDVEIDAIADLRRLAFIKVLKWTAPGGTS